MKRSLKTMVSHHSCAEEHQAYKLLKPKVHDNLHCSTLDIPICHIPDSVKCLQHSSLTAEEIVHIGAASETTESTGHKATKTYLDIVVLFCMQSGSFCQGSVTAGVSEVQCVLSVTTVPAAAMLLPTDTVIPSDTGVTVKVQQSLLLLTSAVSNLL